MSPARPPSIRLPSTMSRTGILVLACLCTLAAGNAGASDTEESSSPQAVIETRQAGFKKMGAALKAMVEQLKSDAPDMAKIATASQVIGAGAEAQLRWFPAGSGTEAGVETDALPHIWKDRAKFDSLANQLIPASKSLTAALAGNDLAAIRAQVKAVADTCATCHRSFRAD
jgi:cytochrome c556